MKFFKSQKKRSKNIRIVNRIDKPDNDWTTAMLSIYGSAMFFIFACVLWEVFLKIMAGEA